LVVDELERLPGGGGRLGAALDAFGDGRHGRVDLAGRLHECAAAASIATLTCARASSTPASSGVARSSA